MYIIMNKGEKRLGGGYSTVIKGVVNFGSVDVVAKHTSNVLSEEFSMKVSDVDINILKRYFEFLSISRRVVMKVILVMLIYINCIIAIELLLGERAKYILSCL